MRLLVLSIVLLGVLAPLAQAHAARPMRAGVLECEGRRTSGKLVMSQARLRCVFRSEGRQPERYVAKVRRYGGRSTHPSTISVAVSCAAAMAA